MRFAFATSAVVFALAAAPALAQETVENGEFKLWSKFKKGTSITTKMTTKMTGFDSEMTITTTLVEVGSDKLVLEGSTVSKAMGMEVKSPPMKRDVPKTFTLPKGTPKIPPVGTKPDGTYEEGTETMKVSGVEVKTKWYKIKSDMDGLKTEAQMWISDDVPGSMVKMVSKTTGLATGETKMEIVEFKKP